MTIERICMSCHKPIKATKVRVKTVCQCKEKGNGNEREPNSKNTDPTKK